jgi:lysozyme
MPYTDAVIDISHHNGNINLANAQQVGILGVFHKATQGTTLRDPMYTTNRAQAQQLGLLWGAYHFGDGSDGAAQANYFLQTVQPGAGMLLALDFEQNPSGPTMTMQQARDFVTQVQSATGIWPGLYGGGYLKGLLAGLADPVLSNCWFWLAEYGPAAQLPPGWANWTLWQYLDGAIVKDPNPIPGITPCDRNYYCDTSDTLQAKWATGSLA